MNIQYLATKAIIKNSVGKVLVLKQSAEKEVDGHGQYHPPGGIVEFGETVEESLVRELKEELDVDSQVIKLLDIGEWRVNIRGDDCQFVGLFYLCELQGAESDFKLQAKEVQSYEWVGLEDIENIQITEPSRTIIDNLLRGRYD